MKSYRPSLTQWIFIGMGAGLAVGWLFPDVGSALQPLSIIFLRLIKSIIAPLIFATLVVGIAGHGNLKQVGRMGLKAIIYFEIVTTLALLIGLTAVHFLQPGVGIEIPHNQQAADIISKNQSFTEIITHIFPQSFFEAAAQGEVLQIVIFAIIFSFALALVPQDKRKTIIDFCDALAETMFKFTSIVMKYAPVGVGAAIAVTVGHKGPGVLRNLGMLVLTTYGALIFLVIIVFGAVIIIARVPPGRFFRAVKEPALIAFSTSSSEAALPRALESMEALGVPRRIVSFVIPTGYSFNLDGSTLYLPLAAIFVAQAVGVELTVGQQVLMILTLMLTSKGVAGVPRASLVILAGTLTSFGLPLEGIAVILGVDQINDMGRSCVNVIGNCLASVVVAKWEGEFSPPNV